MTETEAEDMVSCYYGNMHVRVVIATIICTNGDSIFVEEEVVFLKFFISKISLMVSHCLQLCGQKAAYIIYYMVVLFVAKVLYSY